MEATCVSTVRTLTNSAAAASRLVAPPAIRSATRCSVAVSSVAGPYGGHPRQLLLDLGQQRPVAHLGGQLARAAAARRGTAGGPCAAARSGRAPAGCGPVRDAAARTRARRPRRAPRPRRPPGRRPRQRPGRRSGARRRSGRDGPGARPARAARPRSAARRPVRPDRDVRLGQQRDPSGAARPGRPSRAGPRTARRRSRCRIAAAVSPRHMLTLPRTQAADEPRWTVGDSPRRAGARRRG